MLTPDPRIFDAAHFLANAGLGRRIVLVKAKQCFFTQGQPADSIFYLQKGRAKLTVVSEAGKEATITLLAEGDFIGEEALANVAGLRLASASAITLCTALKIDRVEMVRVLHEEHAFSDLFLKFLLTRGMRTQADLIDQLFNSSEKRLARILLLMAEFGQPGGPETLIPKITQETLAEMVGTTRSPRQLLYESLPGTRLHRIQRPHQGSQIAAKCGPARSAVEAQCRKRSPSRPGHTAGTIAQT